MSRKELLERVRAEQIVGVVREDSKEAAIAVADAFARNGIRILEITLTTPDAFELIAAMGQKYAQSDVIIAAGTVRSSNDAALARRAGAQVIVSPHTDVRVIEYAVENDLLSIAGAATATEPSAPRLRWSAMEAAVSARLVPVSPSGTGKTLIRFSSARCACTWSSKRRRR